MRSRSSIWLLATLVSVVWGCDSAKFSRGGKVVKTEPPADPPICDKEETVFEGLNLLVMIDNSTSNKATDCEQVSQVTKEVAGNSEVFYRCAKATQREVATREVGTYLGNSLIAASNKEVASSLLAVRSFPDPNEEDYASGSPVHFDWRPATLENAEVAGAAAAFSREVFGLTSLTAALTGVKDQFDKLPKPNSKRNLVLLISDGEATDRDPNTAIQLARELAEQSVRVIPVTLVKETDKEFRRNDHRSNLKKLIDEYDQLNSDWVTADMSEAKYMDFLAGGAAEPRLFEKIGRMTNPQCQQECSQQEILVTKNQLSATLKGLVEKQIDLCSGNDG